MVILEVVAKSEKEALELACPYLDVEQDLIDVAVYKKGSSGFLGLGQKKPTIYHILAKPNITPLDVIIKGVISTMLHYMGYRVKFLQITRQEEGKLYVEMASQHAGFIIGKYGRTLEALQFLVNLIVEKIIAESPKILLDIENYRARRAKHLSDVALRTADFVTKTGKSRLLDPLNPYERRLIHMALQEHESVFTESEGNGVYKRVRIARRENYVAADEMPHESHDENFSEEQPEFLGGIDPDGENASIYDDADDNIGNRIDPNNNEES